MALVVNVGITARSRGMQFLEHIAGMEIRRLEPLDNPGSPDDEVHNYRVTSTTGNVTTVRSFTHRYGDGALVCLAKALAALGVSSD